jgi:hypothetical protein
MTTPLRPRNGHVGDAAAAGPTYVDRRRSERRRDPLDRVSPRFLLAGTRALGTLLSAFLESLQRAFDEGRLRWAGPLASLVERPVEGCRLSLPITRASG